MDSLQRFLQRNQAFINNEWIATQEHLNVDNPFDQTVIGTVARCGAEQTEQAIHCAHTAFTTWRQTSAYERAALLNRWSQLIKEHKDSLAKLITYEGGKPLAEAMGEVDYAVSFIDWFAAEAIRVYGDIIPSPNKAKRFLVTKQPIGVVAAITPWNFPAAMITRKCAPALAAGCSIVLKPAEDTPLTALALADLAKQARFPAGVFNVITGDPKPIAAVLTQDPRVKKLSFTGSTQVGKLLIEQTASTVKKLSLELGGNAPFIVFEDSDVDAAIAGLMQTKFRNSGQTCICANRIYVHQTLHDTFVEKLIPIVQALKVGYGLDEGVVIGPLINQAALTKVTNLVEQAINEGAKLACGGKVHTAGAYCYEPTVLTDVLDTMTIAQSEIFGPVVTVFSFESEDDVIERANHTDYGLAAYCFTHNASRIMRLPEILDYAMICVNSGAFSNAATPFGGVKQSGYGREGSKYGIDEYLQIKYTCWDV